MKLFRLSEKKHDGTVPPDRVEKHEISGHELGTLYHGTPDHTMREVDPHKVGRRDAGYFGRGFYASTSKDTATNYRHHALQYGDGNKPRGGKVLKKNLISTSKVLRYNRVVSKNQPDFVDHVIDHSIQHGHIDHSDAHIIKHDDNHSDLPHPWDDAVTRFADHHKYDAVHIIHPPGGSDGADEVRVRNTTAIKGPEQQKKIPALRSLYNFNKPGKTLRHVTSPSGKIYPYHKPNKS